MVLTIRRMSYGEIREALGPPTLRGRRVTRVISTIFKFLRGNDNVIIDQVL